MKYKWRPCGIQQHSRGGLSNGDAMGRPVATIPASLITRKQPHGSDSGDLSCGLFDGNSLLWYRMSAVSDPISITLYIIAEDQKSNPQQGWTPRCATAPINEIALAASLGEEHEDRESASDNEQ